MTQQKGDYPVEYSNANRPSKDRLQNLAGTATDHVKNAADYGPNDLVDQHGCRERTAG
jgi:hypothetical protein